MKLLSSVAARLSHEPGRGAKFCIRTMHSSSKRGDEPGLQFS